MIILLNIYTSTVSFTYFNISKYNVCFFFEHINTYVEKMFMSEHFLLPRHNIKNTLFIYIFRIVNGMLIFNYLLVLSVLLYSLVCKKTLYINNAVDFPNLFYEQ